MAITKSRDRLTIKLTKGYSDSRHADTIEVKQRGGKTLQGGLSISFRRTIRVADNNDTSSLPPDLGTFPIYRTAPYQASLPESMRGKGDYFIPMYRKCALPTTC